MTPAKKKKVEEKEAPKSFKGIAEQHHSKDHFR